MTYVFLLEYKYTLRNFRSDKNISLYDECHVRPEAVETNNNNNNKENINNDYHICTLL